ncbi:BRO1 domain-containing protein [Cynara cardunculus var. scolymus]|uniref:BRO1 domain-containing protein n=1 Tax=Cynara cardunculus var. scolymus TaxID=59895 RepID=A0A103XVG7_CYNCS|nr:BRO1 domain-containing protein [Cynara cardunculus var. scolymus]
MLHFKDPSKLRTKKIVFEAVYPAQDSGTLEQLKELSSKRVNVESINENNSITDAIAREMSGGLTSQCEQDIQKLELYLPLLENLVQHVDLIGDDPLVIRWTSDLKIRWTSVLSSSFFFNLMGPRFFQIDNLRFELGIVLFLYGAMLREWASQLLVTDLVQSATLFRKAAGVYSYLAHEVLPSLEGALTPEGPPEATSSVSSVMSFICLAEAQIVTIMKAEEKRSADGLLAKLHYGVVQLFDEATDFFSTAARECKDISPSLMVWDYISFSKGVHELRSYKYMAQALKTDGQIGTAIGLLQHALNNVQKNVGGMESWRTVMKQDIDTVIELLRKYKHENEFVWHEKVPFDDHLPLLQGKKIATCIPYRPERWERTLALKI